MSEAAKLTLEDFEEDEILETYLTDEDMEKNGVWLNFGKFRVLAARAGGANKRFAKVIEVKSRPYQRAIKTDTMPHDVSNKLMREVYAETVVLDWETQTKSGEWKKAIVIPGEVLPVTKANIIRAFEELPEIFLDLQDQVGKLSNFRRAQLESNAGN